MDYEFPDGNIENLKQFPQGFLGGRLFGTIQYRINTFMYGGFYQ